MSVATLRPSGRAAWRKLDPATLATWLRTASTDVDALEHITVRCLGNQADLVFFCAVDSQDRACAVAEEVCRRALAATRQLAGWEAFVAALHDGGESAG
ncbi:hypothetical protein GT045_27180 [Streptomyces sp. SID486]|uniref:hypothetical protein n=1 Tax=unclassified Streptomyces TaxID=2593676 RepID=UPI00136E3967|nr:MULTISPECIES: hypothetical protein [unclassified Streptomyces]MYW20212.1 hypothetical protein [Streptomyces sp. SID2955]MYW45215.1 hypothetical protein [Streptomyces sp. SID161]MYX94944.1 hypothetical protein [Streptomyces sp. SID486]MYX98386.1 hypothetical protein [Streptomyces sp. SID486]